MAYCCLYPDEMTPQERLNRIVELLALASVRLAEEELGLSPISTPQVNSDQDGVFRADSA